ncbi:MAG: phosphatidylserine decarboxylase family protein [Candidatus Pelagibacter sp.]|nr:phosphatidylserine decarboxylase family protein [Candidatus Pelagibacter sp.]
MYSAIFQKIHNEGYKFVAISVLVTFILLLISKFLGFIGLLITIWVYYFFRDPDRISIDDEDYLVSPADGLITQIIETNGPKEFSLENKKFTRVSIFMSVFNCHVNRSPTLASIEDIFYVPGEFFNATLDKSSEENERNLIKFKTNNGDEIIVVQIAGLIARRIVCECNKSQTLQQGAKIGMIRFGSRVDIYFNNYKNLVKQNQTAVAGETLIAKKQII